MLTYDPKANAVSMYRCLWLGDIGRMTLFGFDPEASSHKVKVYVIIAFTSLIGRRQIIVPHAFIDTHLYALFLA